MLSLKPNSTIQRSSNVVDTNVDNEIVLMNVHEGKYYGANSVGSKIWALLEKPIQFNELCHELENTFDVSQVSTYQEQVVEFLNTLATKKLIEIIE